MIQFPCGFQLIRLRLRAVRTSCRRCRLTRIMVRRASRNCIGGEDTRSERRQAGARQGGNRNDRSQDDDGRDRRQPQFLPRPARQIGARGDHQGSRRQGLRLGRADARGHALRRGRDARRRQEMRRAVQGQSRPHRRRDRHLAELRRRARDRQHAALRRPRRSRAGPGDPRHGRQDDDPAPARQLLRQDVGLQQPAPVRHPLHADQAAHREPRLARIRRRSRPFAATCRVVGSLKNLRVGSIGARPAAFNTVRFSEKILEANGISIETVDLSEIIGRIGKLADDHAGVRGKLEQIRAYAPTAGVPDPR